MIDNGLRLRQFDLKNAYGDTIRTDVRFLENDVKKPTIVICHSFMAFKNWGFFPYLSEYLARAGFVSVIFNFSLNGVSGDSSRITDFERFSRNTFSRELHDVETVIAACSRKSILPFSADDNRIGMLGHSRGGGIAIIHSASDKRIKSLATLASISHFDRWREHQISEWRKNGYLPLARGTHISPLRLGIDILRDIEERADELSITRAASRLTIPWLIVHGKTDGTVHAKEAETLYNAANPAVTELLFIEHAGHLFNAATPAEDGYKTLNHTLELVQKFFHSTL